MMAQVGAPAAPTRTPGVPLEYHGLGIATALSRADV
jgi:hypothetical protein